MMMQDVSEALGRYLGGNGAIRLIASQATQALSLSFVEFGVALAYVFERFE